MSLTFGLAGQQGPNLSLFRVTEFRCGKFWTQLPSANGISLQQSADGRYVIRSVGFSGVNPKSETR